MSRIPCPPSILPNPFSSISRVKVLRLTEHAIIPTHATEGSAGLDLFSAYDTVIPAFGKALIATDIAISIGSPFYYARIAPRSSMAYNQHTSIGGGVIDSDYRGNIIIIMFNHGQNEIKINHGDKIAQLIFEHILPPNIEEVFYFDTTKRGVQGFGSSNNQYDNGEEKNQNSSASENNSTSSPMRTDNTNVLV